MVKREHYPEAGPNEMRHFISEELTEEVGGGVGSLLGTVLNGLVTPWWVIHGYLHSMVMEFLEEVAHRVRNVVKVWCKV